MDPSIMQLLEQDEDETMHSGADVDAFTAALNRDIEGDASTSQPSDSDLSVLSQGNNYTSNQFLHQWNPSTHMENASCTTQQDTMVIQQRQIQTEAIPSESDLQQQENQKAPNESSSQELQQPFSQEQKSFLEDSRQQNASHLSQQAANMNAQVHNPVSDRMHNADYESQLMKLQNMNSQPAAVSRMGNQQSLATTAGVSNKQSVLPGANSQQTMNSTGNNNQLASATSLRGKQVPFGMLLPVIQPQLDKDRAMQLNTIYNRLRKNEIPKEDFVRHMKSIVGDQMLKMAVYKLQSQAARNAQNMPQLAAQAQAQAPAPAPAPAQQWQLPTASDGNMSANKARDIERVPGVQTPMAVYGSSASNYQPFSGQNANVSASALKLGPHDPQTRHIPAYQNMSTTPLGMTTQGMNVSNMSKFDRQNPLGDPKRLQGSSPAHMTNPSALPQNSVWQPSSSSNEQKSGTSSSMSYVKQEPFDQPELHRPQISAPYGSGVLTPSSSVHAAPGNLISGNLKDESVDMQYSRAGFSTNVLTSNLKTPISGQTDTFNSLNSRATPTAPPVTLGNNAKTSSKKSTGQKKPLEVPGSSPPPSSKKQKVSGAFLDQSIEQLNDVTAVSGVDLREEEEQLFSGPKEDSRVTEASRRVVQEEEEKLIIEKVPFQRKLAEIMAKSGLKGISNDVERCLSLCLEERIRGLISNLIRVSKQRLDIEKPRHKTIVTSDVGQQIMSMNQKAKAEWEKKQAEADKLLKLNEPEGNPGADGEKDKDENRSRMAKQVVVNKEEDDKMRTTAANVAARAAVGGDDMLSKWTLMAEQARQKREGDGASTTSHPPPERDIERKQSSSSSASVISLKDNQQVVDKKGQSTTSASSTPATGGVSANKKVGKSQAVVVSDPKVAHSSISVKDVVAVLEREPQMSRSTLIYRLYEKIRSEAAAAAAAVAAVE